MPIEITCLGPECIAYDLQTKACLQNGRAVKKGMPCYVPQYQQQEFLNKAKQISERLFPGQGIEALFPYRDQN
ncbi:hypothetical protein GOV12_05565 [Candidatus Pacearchaeota archaeon]|nr:hypothetical protein [Candidatus Pacearchaeota archaeon]